MINDCWSRVFPALALMLSVVNTGYGQPKAPPGPAPGRLVDVYGHKMHINCVGPVDATPTIVFEAGGGAFSNDWTAVQKLLPPTVRACAYDRSGLGWSEPGPGPRTMKQEVFELHGLLELAGISGPFILVGQSIGALNVRLYSEQYGSEVAGVILVDPADESSKLFYVPANRWMQLRDQAKGRSIPPVRRAGPPSTGYKPEEDYLGDEAQLIYLHRQQNPALFGDRPLFVLAAGKRRPPGMTEESYEGLKLTKDKERALKRSIFLKTRS